MEKKTEMLTRDHILVIKDCVKYFEETHPEMTKWDKEKVKEIKEIKTPDYSEEIKLTYILPNEGKRWCREDDEKLEFLYKAGKTVGDLVEIFGRKQSSIVKRLKKLDLWSGDND